ncbi:MAG: riboflavin kinase [Patescibacteria group bacterium]
MFTGKIVHGNSIGKKLGFPTANLDIPRDQVSLNNGVYAGFVNFRGKKYLSAIPILSDHIEVYLLDYSGEDFYGEILEVEVIGQVSQIEKLDSEKKLKKKLAQDVRMVREVLKN